MNLADPYGMSSALAVVRHLTRTRHPSLLLSHTTANLGGNRQPQILIRAPATKLVIEAWKRARLANTSIRLIRLVYTA